MPAFTASAYFSTIDSYSKPHGHYHSGRLPSDNAEPKQPSVAAQSCTGGCVAYPTWCEPPIKGNVSFKSGERIYHVPGQEYYDETVINPDYGERWFCSEEEAMDAGWRRAFQ